MALAASCATGYHAARDRESIALERANFERFGNVLKAFMKRTI